MVDQLTAKSAVFCCKDLGKEVISLGNELCRTKHIRIDEKLNTHERRLNNHGERIDQLEQHKSRIEVMVENLFAKIDGLIVTMRWFMGLLVPAILGLLIWAIQQGLSK